MPEHKACSSLIFDGKEVEIFADPAVIASESFFLTAFVFSELIRGFPGSSINPLELGFGFVTTPVSTGDAFQLKCLGMELLGVLHVGTGTEIPPLIPKCVEGDGLL